MGITTGAIQGILLISAVMAVFFILCYHMLVQASKEQGRNKAVQSDAEKMNLSILMILALFTHLFAAVLFKDYSHEQDMNCFVVWARMVYEDGFGAFYHSQGLTDYPPGYMYVLYVVGWLHHIFSIQSMSMVSILLTKMPAILCDLLTGYLLYRIAGKNLGSKKALWVASAYLLNPAVWFISAVWGQVDSVFTLFLVLMCYCITQKKLIPAYFSLAIGILMKPQMMIFTPVLIYGIIDQVFLHNFTYKRMLKELGMGLLAIALMFLLALPFGLEEVIGQYTKTMGSYPYATVNAYNFWTLQGMNWQPQETVRIGMSCSHWGTVFILAFLAVSVWLSYKMKDKKEKYYFISAFIIISMFFFSVRMHERYLFPAMVLLLLTYIEKPEKEMFSLYGMFSVYVFWNAAHVLYCYDYSDFDRWEAFPVFVSMAGLCTYIYLGYVMYRDWLCAIRGRTMENAGVTRHTTAGRHGKNTGARGRRGQAKSTGTVMCSHKLSKIDRIDIGVMVLISLVYAAVAFHGLGDKDAPQSGLIVENMYDSYVIDLGEVREISEIAWYNGYQHNPKFAVSTAVAEGEWTPLYDEQNALDIGDVFYWGRVETSVQARYLNLTNTSGKCQLMELVLLDEDKKPLKVAENEQTKALFDEQDLYCGRTTDKNSTYFDEIYHARTAYELLHNMRSTSKTDKIYCYENTHPPLGKIIIALGIGIFGMCPFGWRFMGCLFGVLMLPVLYIFAKKLLDKRAFAIAVTLLFAFDFMHFAQTRIATIDVFITFFVIVMYYFMYLYTQMSFYDTKLTKTFIPLAFSGLFMGIGCATKWTGVYAGIGLAVIFFACIWMRYREYRLALKNPGGSTNGIRHEKIVQAFFPNMWKTFGFCLLVFVAIPCIIYLLSYLPFYDGTDRGLIARMLKNQETMFTYHSGLEAEHDFSSVWFQWPFMYRPIWYYSGHVTDNIKEGISAFGNPLVWWCGVPAFLYMLYRIYKYKDGKACFLCAAYLAQYVPWFFVSRLTFIYHYFPSVPFVTLMLGYTCYQFAGDDKKRQRAVYVYVAASMLLFVLFYPVLSGKAVDNRFVNDWLRWLDTWVLVSGP